MISKASEEYLKTMYVLKKQNGNDYECLCRLMLTSIMSECAKSFERLPILLHADIIRNVLYSGVWSKYAYIQAIKQKKAEKAAAKEHQ